MLKTITLTNEQFDKLEEAADIMALDMVFTDTLGQAIEYLSEKYIHEKGPDFEVEWEETETPASSTEEVRH